MSIFKRLPSSAISGDNKGHKLPSSKVAKEFSEVAVRPLGNKVEIGLSIMMDLTETDEAENWQTGIALDTSSSMKGYYGRRIEGQIPDKVLKEYKKKGYLQVLTSDHQYIQRLSKPAVDDAVKRGFVIITQNILEKIVKEYANYLSSKLDEDGQTTIIYWGSSSGDEIEVLGDFDQKKLSQIKIDGPNNYSFGSSTSLAPVMNYFATKFKDAKKGLYLVVTDGQFDDLDAVKTITTRYAKEIDAGTRNPLKFVLIGVGPNIDKDKLEQLDDIDTGTDIDIWDHKIAAEMRNVTEIFAELVSENMIVAPTATIYDDKGNIVSQFTDGVPAKIMFELPETSQWFEMEVYGNKIRQMIK